MKATTRIFLGLVHTGIPYNEDRGNIHSCSHLLVFRYVCMNVHIAHLKLALILFLAML